MLTYTSAQTAKILNVDVSRVLKLCKDGRLGITLPRHGKSWVITNDEIEAYRKSGPRKAGRRRKRKTKQGK